MRSRTSARFIFFEGQTSSFFVIWTRSPDFFSSFGISLAFQPSLRGGVHLAVLPGAEAPGYFLSPLRGWFYFARLSHGLRRGLHSFAASRLPYRLGLKALPNSRSPDAGLKPGSSTKTLSMARAAGCNVFYAAHVVLLY